MKCGTQIRILLIRHGETAGNLEKRYVGRTDEELCSAGRQKMERIRKEGGGYFREQETSCRLPGFVQTVFVSPMKRCIQSAEILFPGIQLRAIPDMQECDFGEFEYKNYAELSEDIRYQEWISSGGTKGFPGGEEPAAFRARICIAFENMVDEILQTQTCSAGEGRHGEDPDFVYALVCHGGCIMAIMDRFAQPHRDYFDWQLKNGQWLEICLDLEKWGRGEKTLYLAGDESIVS